MAILHRDREWDKSRGTDISNMLRTFKSFDDGACDDEFLLFREEYKTL